MILARDYPNAWGIENVAVVPAYRGRGVVDELMRHALEDGRQHGREHAQILCLNGNERALRAWERNGFVLRADYQSRDFDQIFGCRGMKLLAQEL